MGPGVPRSAPGLPMVMKNQKTSERVAELMHEMIDVFQRGESIPDSPIETIAPAKTRRHLRRTAERLRRGEIQPRSKNLFTAEQLADLCENTARRDEMFHQAKADFVRLGRALARLVEEDPEGARRSMDEVFGEALRLARKHGPASKAAARYRQLVRLTHLAHMYSSDRRRQKKLDPARRAMAHDPSKRLFLTPAELLARAPDGEAVLPFPAVGEDSGRSRLLIRIGVGASSWIGSFECGLTRASTIFIMPDGKHLFVLAYGAGYILDLKSRTLVERSGTEIVGVRRDPEMTLFVVNHNNVIFEAFGPEGRLWKREAASWASE